MEEFRLRVTIELSGRVTDPVVLPVATCCQGAGVAALAGGGVELTMVPASVSADMAPGFRAEAGFFAPVVNAAEGAGCTGILPGRDNIYQAPPPMKRMPAKT